MNLDQRFNSQPNFQSIFNLVQFIISEPRTFYFYTSALIICKRHFINVIVLSYSPLVLRVIAQMSQQPRSLNYVVNNLT